VFIIKIDLASSYFFRSSSQASDDVDKGVSGRGSDQDPSEKIMTPWTFDVKFPLGTQFTFGSLTFAAGEDEYLRMLPPGPALERIAPTDG
jgi:hypothetical protein